jgi:hypothetical protein
MTADGACDTRRCHNAIADRGAFGSSHRAEMPSRGSQPPQVPSRATRRSRRRNIWVGHSGGTAAATTAEVASTYAPGQKTIRWIVFPAIPAIGCTARNHPVSA